MSRGGSAAGAAGAPAAVIPQLRDDGTTILLAEQNARAALALADDAVLLRTGAVVAAGSAAELRDGELVREIYLGAA